MGKKHVIFEDDHAESTDQNHTAPSKISRSEKELERIKKEAYEKGLKDAAKKIVQSDMSTLEVDGQREGIRKQVVEDAKEEKAAKTKLEQLDKREKIVLFKTNTFFPFDLFPDTLIIDTSKISIIKKEFFASHNVITINLKDLVDVEAETALFLGNIIITYLPRVETIGMIKPTIATVRLLKKNDALRANYILKGILVARREKIDITKISAEDLIKTIERFGKSRESPLE